MMIKSALTELRKLLHEANESISIDYLLAPVKPTGWRSMGPTNQLIGTESVTTSMNGLVKPEAQRKLRE